MASERQKRVPTAAPRAERRTGQCRRSSGPLHAPQTLAQKPRLSAEPVGTARIRASLALAWTTPACTLHSLSLSLTLSLSHTHTHTHTHWAWLHAPSTHDSRRHPVCQACLELLVSPALQGDPGREGERRGEKRKRKWGKVEPHRVQCGLQTTLEGKKWRAKALMYLPGGPGDPSDRDHPGRQEGKQGSV